MISVISARRAFFVKITEITKPDTNCDFLCLFVPHPSQVLAKEFIANIILTSRHQLNLSLVRETLQNLRHALDLRALLSKGGWLNAS